MEGSIKDLALYRLQTAKDDLKRAEFAYEMNDYKLALNRSYYAIFHAIRAVNSLDGYDSSKHKGVITHFNKEHVKTGEFPKDISKMIANAMNFRQKSDYEDFYIISKDDAKEQVANAGYVLELIEKYLSERIDGK